MCRIASMAQGYQICHCEERSDVAISQNPTGQQGSHRRNRNCLPEIAPQGHFLALRAQGATAPLGPRNDKLGSLAPQNVCRKDCQTAWRSLSAATGTIGTHHFNGGLYELQMPSRDCTPRALPRAARSGRHVGLRPPRNDKSEGHCGRRCYSATCQPARRSLSAATFFSRAAALCSERRCRPRRDRFPLYRRPVRVGSIAPGPAVHSPAMITPSGPPA